MGNASPSWLHSDFFRKGMPSLFYTISVWIILCSDIDMSFVTPQLPILYAYLCVSTINSITSCQMPKNSSITPCVSIGPSPNYIMSVMSVIDDYWFYFLCIIILNLRIIKREIKTIVTFISVPLRFMLDDGCCCVPGAHLCNRSYLEHFGSCYAGLRCDVLCLVTDNTVQFGRETLFLKQ